MARGSGKASYMTGTPPRANGSTTA